MSTSKNKVAKIKANINTWNELRNTNIALNFLTSGYGFAIEHEDYINWKKNSPDSIHCYFGVDEFELKFYVIDNVSDTNQSYELGVNLFEKEFTRSFNTAGVKTTKEFKPLAISCSDQICKSDAEQRILNWMLGSKNWFKDQVQKNKSGNGELLRLITVPFEDVETLFTNSDQTVFVMTALKKFDVYGYNLEFILTRELELSSTRTQDPSGTELFMDVSQPHPPFSIIDQGFNLL
ncbi:hypothetical protein [Aquimarina sp. AU474]|uniref:hypothetical protein n=1 Tax=Aquimarina sp. AU474 TaxID=2108529 RepID=UPI000D6975F2|nr:hypothetical protein [Aquimarina sp. AU474]